MDFHDEEECQTFYDIISPYSWIGFEIITRYTMKWNINLQLKPTFFGAVIKHHGNPAPFPAIKLNTRRDLPRLAKHYKIPLNPPKNFHHVAFVKTTMKPGRFLTSVSLVNPSSLEETTRQLWLRIWSRDEDVTEVESLHSAGVLGGLTEEEVWQCLKIMDTDRVKTEFRKTTQEAIDNGCYGMPFFLIETDGGEEAVFGSDRFHIIADLLGESYVGHLNELSKLPTPQQ